MLIIHRYFYSYDRHSLISVIRTSCFAPLSLSYPSNTSPVYERLLDLSCFACQVLVGRDDASSSSFSETWFSFLHSGLESGLHVRFVQSRSLKINWARRHTHFRFVYHTHPGIHALTHQTSARFWMCHNFKSVYTHTHTHKRKLPLCHLHTTFTTMKQPSTMMRRPLASAAVFSQRRLSTFFHKQNL